MNQTELIKLREDVPFVESKEVFSIKIRIVFQNICHPDRKKETSDSRDRMGRIQSAQEY